MLEIGCNSVIFSYSTNTLLKEKKVLVIENTVISALHTKDRYRNQ